MIDLFRVSFPVAGIETSLFLPPAAAFAISYFTSMAGISGAFLLLPFQVSVLGFASPSASATNFVYNVVGTPGGFIRYAAEKRLVWPLHVAAGAVLLSNFATSLSGVLFYSFFAFGNGNSAPPDLLLGVLFGLGGLLGMYCGARTQHRVSEKAIKWILTAIVFSTALKYTHSYLFRPV